MITKEDEKNSESGELFFRVDAALLLQLGEQLVAKRSIALAELVKNAYDADATEVVVHLKNVADGGGTIVVRDNGTGMTFRDIQRAWMTIATPEKLYDPLSRIFRRPRAGAKGVGRFAARRLARRLILRTVGEIPGAGARELVEVDFDWDKFNEGQTIEAIGNRFRKEKRAADEPLGTTLVLLDAREAWSERDVHELEQSLNDLISPFAAMVTTEGTETGLASDPGFSINLHSAEYPQYSGKLEDRFLKTAYATLKGYLKNSGEAEYELTFRDEDEKLQFVPPDTTFPQVGPTIFEIRVFMYGKAYFKGQDFSVTEARKIARERSGVRIFFENFRVPGYGEPRDDWLLLDSERAGRLTGTPAYVRELAEGLDRPMLLLPGNNQLFGAVYLSRENNPNLEVTLSRERLMEAESFEELRKFVRSGIDWMTVVHARRVAEEREGTKQLEKDDLSPRERLAAARRQVLEVTEKISERRSRHLGARDTVSEERLTTDEEIQKDLAAIQESLEITESGLATAEQEFITELAMLRVLASTGTMVTVFQHQHGAILNGIRLARTELAQFAQSLGTHAQIDFSGRLSRLSAWIEDIENLTGLLGLMYGKESRDHQQPYLIRPIVDKIREAFGTYMEERGIVFHNGVPSYLSTPPMYQCEVAALLLNLMTNSLKALQERARKNLFTVSNSLELPPRAIRVDGCETRTHIVIRFYDTGKGADRDKWDAYFRPFVGDSEPDPVLGQGTGLGLAIVKNLVHSYGGNAAFVEPQHPWATCLELTLPQG